MDIRRAILALLTVLIAASGTPAKSDVSNSFVKFVAEVDWVGPFGTVVFRGESYGSDFLIKLYGVDAHPEIIRALLVGRKVDCQSVCERRQIEAKIEAHSPFDAICNFRVGEKVLFKVNEFVQKLTWNNYLADGVECRP